MLKKVIMPYLRSVIMPILLGAVSGFVLSMIIGYFETKTETPEGETAAAEVAIPTFDTKETLIDYALDAALNLDSRAMMAILTPETLQRLCKDNRKLLVEYIDIYLAHRACSPGREQRIREIMNNPEAKKQLIEKLTAQDQFIQLDGKWYLTDAEYFQFIYKFETAYKAVKAIHVGDADAIWNLLSDTSKTSAISKYSNKANAKVALLNHCKGVLQKFRDAGKDDKADVSYLMPDEFVLMEVLPFTLSGGRYYLAPEF